ncbi:MAG: hypothetical protein HXY23_14280 [Parvularculaceae bacterium]|nr:hypothetical protein [Parvularculaceae bacterium]
MALTKADREFILLTVKSAVNDSISQLADRVRHIEAKVDTHETTLHGKFGNNGLRSHVKHLNRFAWLLTGGLILAGSLIGAVKLF